mmetsp:Transcript_59635/g.185018  ORF Transcript_59635/g.185018 Transcript_59635/m.185018 type:complete len:96 (-) Transcript_59635:11-298(-)
MPHLHSVGCPARVQVGPTLEAVEGRDVTPGTNGMRPVPGGGATINMLLQHGWQRWKPQPLQLCRRAPEHSGVEQRLQLFVLRPRKLPEEVLSSST